MKARIYTDEEIEILKKCYFINDVLYKRELVYDPVFKLWTIFMRFECPNLSAREIFDVAGIEVDILNKDIPKDRIHDWMYAYKRYGVKYFFSPNEAYTITDEFKKQLLENILKELKKYE